MDAIAISSIMKRTRQIHHPMIVVPEGNNERSDSGDFIRYLKKKSREHQFQAFPEHLTQFFDRF